MNSNIFLIFGYGTPRDIFHNENYNFYLKITFNQIFEITRNNDIKKPLIICSGGNTDLVKPYKKTEAGEMLKLLKALCQRELVKNITKTWLPYAENKSLSTLENLLNSKKVINKRGIKKGNIYIFCEYTRKKRIQILSKKIFSTNFKIKVMPIDFDTSSNRYLDTEFIKNKESLELKHSLWALRSKSNLKKHHQIFQEKVYYFRKLVINNHPQAVKTWWEEKIKELTEDKL